ncbi:unnamed protein product [Moneuplotes crassus]|uniref:Uncharacterized protein n=1 Tax=Euplotes crassus TaxID=5936 RepID=A0AAD2CY38_EUPCR|nr:unnamed protein product [Moneuplotes crassus]
MDKTPLSPKSSTLPSPPNPKILLEEEISTGLTHIDWHLFDNLIGVGCARIRGEGDRGVWVQGNGELGTVSLGLQFETIKEPRFNTFRILKEFKVFDRVADDKKPYIKIRGFGEKEISRACFRRIIQSMRKSARKEAEHYSLYVKMADTGGKKLPFSLCKINIFRNLHMIKETLNIEGFKLGKNDIMRVLVASRHLFVIKISDCQIPEQKFTKNFLNTKVQEGINIEEICFNDCTLIDQSGEKKPLYLIKNLMDGILGSSLPKYIDNISFKYSDHSCFMSLKQASHHYKKDKRLIIMLEMCRVSFDFMEKMEEIDELD